MTPGGKAWQVLAMSGSGAMEREAGDWRELGSPPRLGRVLRRYRKDIELAPCAPPEARGQLDLARLGCLQSGFASKASSLRS
jgi:hypothetical protein